MKHVIGGCVHKLALEVKNEQLYCPGEIHEAPGIRLFAEPLRASAAH